MLTNPKENRTQSTLVLIEEFQRKGYQCRQEQQQDATVIFLTHEKKNATKTTGFFPEASHESVKNFLRLN